MGAHLGAEGLAVAKDPIKLIQGDLTAAGNVS